MGENIHWGVINVLEAAAEAFIEKEQESIELLSERRHFADVEGNDAEHLERNIESARRRIDEVETFRETLLAVELGEVEIEDIMTDSVRAWLWLGIESVRGATRRQMGKMGVSPDEIDDVKRCAEYDLPFDDRQRAIWQHLQQIALVEQGGAFLQGDKPEPEQAAEPAAGDGAADRQFIGWRGTPEQLEELAGELQKETFVASAEAFAGQFKDAGGAVDGPCRWLESNGLLVFLFDKLRSDK
jgi:hypothetical protein